MRLLELCYNGTKVLCIVVIDTLHPLRCFAFRGIFFNLDIVLRFHLVFNVMQVLTRTEV